MVVKSGLGDAHGLVDVNKYTLQHKRYENIFAFGDCIGGELTRTHSAAQAQNPVIKNNVLKYLHGQEVNAIYDGYTFFPMYLAMTQATSFSHYHDYEPHTWNHFVPHHGIFSKQYFGRMHKNFEGEAKNYSSYRKNQGPPYYHIANSYDALEHNDYLQTHQIPLEAVIHPVAQARLAAG